MEFSEKLEEALVEGRSVGPESKKLKSLIKSHKNGDLRAFKVKFFLHMLQITIQENLNRLGVDKDKLSMRISFGMD